MKNRYRVFFTCALLACLLASSGCHKESYKDKPRELEAVDLGLPSGTLWASQNLMADRPWALGKTFRWGDTRPAEESQGYCFLEDGQLTKYNFDENKGVVDNRYFLESEDDAATALLGDEWRMPTIWEFEELHDYCNWEKEKINGELCYVVSSKVNTNSIILPLKYITLGLFFIDFTFGEAYEYWTNCVSDDNSNAWLLQGDALRIKPRGRGSAYIRPVYAGRVPVEDVKINEVEPIPAGTKKSVSVSIIPVNALDKRLKWESGDDEVLYVDSKGNLTALFPGKAQIRATSIATGQTSVTQVVVTDYVSPEKVDLGLPSGLLWADRNLGAIDESDPGLKFCWGATRPRGEDQGYVDYSVFYPEKEAYSNGVLSLDYDAANVILGDGWRLPTRAEFKELTDNTVFSDQGYAFTSIRNGRTLSLQSGYCWTSEYVDESKFYVFTGWSRRIGAMNGPCAEWIRPVFDPRK